MEKESNMIRRLNHFIENFGLGMFSLFKQWNNNDQTQMSCFCKNLAQYELCYGCVKRRYLINFKAKKICLFEIPEYTQKEL